MAGQAPALSITVKKNQEFWHGYHQWITYQRQTPPVNPNLEKLSKGAWAVRDGEWALYFL